jgi:HEAT repeat protein
VLRESRLVIDRAREVLPEHRKALSELPARLSQPETLSQLLQSLDESVVYPTEEDLGELFRELRGEALETVFDWLPRLRSEQVRQILGAAVMRAAVAYPDQLAAALGSENHAVVLETARLAARLKLPPLVPALGGMLIREIPPDLKAAAVDALAAIGTPGAMQQLERAVQDEHREVRVAAVRVLGSRGHRAALPKIEAVVLGRELKTSDLTEKMVFFEAYGVLSGPEAIPHLKSLLAPGGGFMRKRQEPAIRACAAMALGKIRTPEARAALEETAADKDPLVRNAVTKALREAVG